MALFRSCFWLKSIPFFNKLSNHTYEDENIESLFAPWIYYDLEFTPKFEKLINDTFINIFQTKIRILVTRETDTIETKTDFPTFT